MESYEVESYEVESYEVESYEVESYEVESMIRGYQEVWEAAIGETLPCQQERGNIHDPYAVTVFERGVIVGPYPQFVTCSWGEMVSLCVK